MSNFENKMMKNISKELPDSCVRMRYEETTKSRERNNEIAKEKEALMLDNQKVMRSIKKEKRKMKETVRFVVNKKMELNEVERIYTLLCNKVKMDTNEFMKEYETLISPYFWWEGKNHTPNEICNYLYPAICKRMSEESPVFGLWV